MKGILTHKTICVSLLLVMSCICAEAKPQDEVKRGMSKEEVRAILGKPDNTSFDPYSEQWEYYKSRGPLKYDKMLYVVFDEADRVTHYSSFTVRGNVNNHNQTSIVIDRETSGNKMAHWRRCMDKQSFALLKDKVHKSNFNENKMNLVEVACLGFYFNCSQCARIMEEFSFGDSKLAVLKKMADRIVDPHNAMEIYKVLDFESDRVKAEKILQAGMSGMRP